MYFWNLHELKQEMAIRPLSDREVLPYVVVFTALTSAVTNIPEATFNFWDGSYALASVVIAIGGTLYVYQRNGGSEGNHFLQRWLVVGWVVGVRLLVFVVPILVLVIFIIASADTEIPAHTTWYEFLAFAAIEALYWQRVAHHVGEVAQRVDHLAGASEQVR